MVEKTQQLKDPSHLAKILAFSGQEYLVLESPDGKKKIKMVFYFNGSSRPVRSEFRIEYYSDRDERSYAAQFKNLEDTTKFFNSIDENHSIKNRPPEQLELKLSAQI